jgi:two-component system, NarL family, nitrate/nitrite response regulator NarL
MSLRCLIVDDNASFLEEAAALLRREGLVVAGFASNMDEALERARELQPDVALVDIFLGSENGLEVARRLVAAYGATLSVILISTHAEGDFADLIEEAPVAGFVAKSELSRPAIRRLVGRPSGTRGT